MRARGRPRRSPNPTGDITSELLGTSCSSPDSCAAVGSYYINTSGEVGRASRRLERVFVGGRANADSTGSTP